MRRYTLGSVSEARSTLSLDRRGRDQREQVGHLRELLGGGPHGLVHLALHRAELHALARHREAALALAEQLVDVEAVAAVGRHPAGRGVRVLEQPGLLEPRQLGADRRRPPGHVVELGDPLGADGLVALDVRLDQPAKDEALPGGDLHGPECSRNKSGSRFAGPDQASG
jgi:hypothetical protein